MGTDGNGDSDRAPSDSEPSGTESTPISDGGAHEAAAGGSVPTDPTRDGQDERGKQHPGDERRSAFEAKRELRDERRAVFEAKRELRDERRAVFEAKREMRDQRRAASQGKRQKWEMRASGTRQQGSVLALEEPLGPGTAHTSTGSPTRQISISDRPVVVYASTASGMPPLKPYLVDLWTRRHFLWHLTRSDLKANQYDTALGQLWLLLNPLLMALVYLLIRGILRPSMGGGGRSIDFLAHLVIGIFFYQYTAGSFTAGSRAMLSFRGFILNASFPRAIFPMEVVLKAILEFLPAIGVIVLVQAGLSQPITWALLWVPFLFLFQTTFNLGLALIFAPLLVFHRDLKNIMNFMTRAWFFLTPIIFMASEVPDRWLRVMSLNPLFPLFSALENVFTFGVSPTRGQLLAVCAWSIGTFVFGMVYFLRREREVTGRL